MTRSSFATEFLLRELLSSLGAPLTAASEPSDSFSESLSEHTESQSAVPSPPSRVVLVRRTNSVEHTVTLVDRDYDIEAYIPRHVMMELQQEYGYSTIGRLRGSVVRVTKYLFATITRCRFLDQHIRATSVCVPNVKKDTARVYLYVDALAIVEDNELAVQPLPEVYTHPLVVKRLKTLDVSELEKQLMIHQGLLPLPADASDRLDDEVPLLEADCVIPEDQEQALEEQKAWGPLNNEERPITDSELIEENGLVPLSESQIMTYEVENAQSIQSSLVDLSVTSSENSLSGDLELEDPGYHFQQEDIRETFVAGSDSGSELEDRDNESEEMKESRPSTPNARFSNEDALNEETMQKTRSIIDLTDESIATVSKRVAAQDRKARTDNTTRNEEEQLTTAPGGVLGEKEDDEVVTIPKNHESANKRTSATSWGFLNTLASMFSTENSDVDKGENNMGGRNQEHTPNQNQDDKNGERCGMEDKLAPEEYMSSQATMVLHYAIDNDEDAHAFEHEGMASSHMVKDGHDGKKSSENPPLDEEKERVNDLTLTEEEANVATTPPKESRVTNETGVGNPSMVARTATRETAERIESVSRQSLPVVHLPASPGNSTHGTHKVANGDLSAESSAKAYPISTPPKIVISVGSDVHLASRTGFSSAESQRPKRRHCETISEDNPRSNARSDGQSIAQHIKSRRRGMLQTHNAQEATTRRSSCERPVGSSFIQNRRVVDRSTDTTDVYSLNVVCQRLDSDRHSDIVQEETTRTTRHPRRAWKRYESLFPPLNMTLLKQRMAEGTEGRGSI